jgi:hypothetical protein
MLKEAEVSRVEERVGDAGVRAGHSHTAGSEPSVRVKDSPRWTGSDETGGGVEGWEIVGSARFAAEIGSKAWGRH